MHGDLFQRLGGRAGIERIVGGLYDRLEKDRELKRLFGSRRSGERARQVLFFEELFGGEPRHSAGGHADVGMQRRHVHRAITPDEADRWLAHFEASMAAAEVDAAKQREVTSILRGPALRLTNPGAPYATVLATIALASKGDLEGVKRAVAQYPALINQRSGDGVTLLWEACRRGRMPLVTWLVETGAGVEIPGSHAHASSVMVSPYCIAVKNGHQQVAAYLEAHGATIDAFAASYLGLVDVLSQRLDVDPRLVHLRSPQEDFYPLTPLHYAVDGGQVEAARLLIEHEADVSPYSRRLLTTAARLGSLELTELLLEHGADASQSEDVGPLEDGDPAIARLLIAHGLDLDKPVRGRETFLSRDCRGDKGEHPLAVQTLIDLGAGVNQANGFGRTPLHAAAKGGFARVIEVLLRNGADVHALDAGGATPLDLARTARRAEAEALLLAAGEA